jgi:hypothetical protein
MTPEWMTGRDLRWLAFGQCWPDQDRGSLTAGMAKDEKMTESVLLRLKPSMAALAQKDTGRKS